MIDYVISPPRPLRIGRSFCRRFNFTFSTKPRVCCFQVLYYTVPLSCSPYLICYVVWLQCVFPNHLRWFKVMNPLRICKNFCCYSCYTWLKITNKLKIRKLFARIFKLEVMRQNCLTITKSSHNENVRTTVFVLLVGLIKEQVTYCYTVLQL